MKVTVLMNNQNDVIIEPDDGRPVKILNCRNYELPAVLSSLDVETITVKFRTTKGFANRDMKKCMRRLQSLKEFYGIADFAPLVIDGHVHDTTFVTTLTRKEKS